MFWPHPLRRALLISDTEPPSPGSYKVAVDGASTPPPAVSGHIVVDIPDGDDGDGEDDYELETLQYISPVRRVLVKAAFVAFTGFAAPALVTTALTRSSNFLQALPILMLVALSIFSLYMATLRVFEYEDMEREREEEGDGLETSAPDP